MSESFDQQPLADIIKSYLYQEYQDDETLQAFVSAQNDLAQGYLDWFNQTPLGVYTNPNINGPLLDWCAQGIYGISRPTISNTSNSITGEMASLPMGLGTMGVLTVTQSGTAIVANDDIYKRLLTWFLYRGDGKQVSILWLKRRIARFIYGTYGSDIDVSLADNISITQVTNRSVGPYNTCAYNANPYNGYTAPIRHQLACAIPSYLASFYFQALVESGVIPLPFQISLTIRPGFWLGLTSLGTATLGG